MLIRSFADEDTERLFDRERVAKFQDCERVAFRRLRELNNARSLHDLRGAGLSLEAFDDQYHVRISGMWRLSFGWRDGDAYDVKITKHSR